MKKPTVVQVSDTVFENHTIKVHQWQETDLKLKY